MVFFFFFFYVKFEFLMLNPPPIQNNSKNGQIINEKAQSLITFINLFHLN